MKLNLKQLNATEVTFEVALPLSNAAIGKLHSCFATKTAKAKQSTKASQIKPPFVFGRDYKVDEQVHYERAVVFKDDKVHIDGYRIIISYSTNAPLFGIEYIKRQLKPIAELFNCLIGIDKKIALDVKAFFVYPESKYTTAILNLPIKLEKNDFFDEIRGVRFTKTQDDKIAYSVIMDRPGNKDIFANLFFQYVGTLNKDLPENIIKYSTEISRRVVSEK